MQFALQDESLKERRPWQDSNLQSLLRVAREGARTNALSIWPQGQAHACCNEKRPWQDSNLHILVQPSRHHPEGVAQRASARMARESNALSVRPQGQVPVSRRKKRPWQDSNLQILSNPTIPGRDMPMPYPFGHRVKCRETKRDAHNDWQRNPTLCGK